MKTTGVLVLEFGSPSTLQVVRRLRQLGVYAEIHGPDTDPADLANLDPRGVVLSGGTTRPPAAEPPLPRRAVFDAGLPLLALGDGVLMLAARLRGRLRDGPPPSFGLERVGLLRQSPLFETLLGEGRFEAWMCSGDTIDEAPPGFVVTAKGERGGVAAMEHLSKRLFALRFHPEQPETDHGLQILANFVHGICECPGNWDLDDHAKIGELAMRSRPGNPRVACPLDPSPEGLVSAALLAATCGADLAPVLIDDGTLAPGPRDALLAFSRERLGREAARIPAAELPEGTPLRLTALARRLEAGYVLDAAAPARPAPRPERRDGRPAPVTHVWPLGQLLPEEWRHLAEAYAVPGGLLAPPR